MYWFWIPTLDYELKVFGPDALIDVDSDNEDKTIGSILNIIYYSDSIHYLKVNIRPDRNSYDTIVKDNWYHLKMSIIKDQGQEETLNLCIEPKGLL